MRPRQTRGLVARAGVALLITLPTLAATRPPHAVGAGSRAATGGTLTVAYSTDAATFDPQQSINPPDNGITTGALFSGLYRINQQGRLVPDIAAGMPIVSRGETVFTIKLKHGVMFNGVGFTPRALTAADVVYTVERVLNPKLKPGVSPWQGNDTSIVGATAYINGKAQQVSGVQALDPYTVRFTLTRPLASFPYILATTGNFIVPKEAVTTYGADFGSHPVGSGPFMLQSWTKGHDGTREILKPHHRRGQDAHRPGC